MIWHLAFMRDTFEARNILGWSYIIAISNSWQSKECQLREFENISTWCLHLSCHLLLISGLGLVWGANALPWLSFLEWRGSHDLSLEFCGMDWSRCSCKCFITVKLHERSSETGTTDRKWLDINSLQVRIRNPLELLALLPCTLRSNKFH